MNIQPMHNDCSIRPARSDDTDAILSFIATGTDQPDYLHEVWDAWLTDPRGPLLVAEVCGQPVATGKLTMLSATEAWLEGLRVHPAFRRRGLARRLMNERLALARTAGACVARTFVFVANHAMHHLLDATGWQQVLRVIYATADPLETLHDSPTLSADYFKRYAADQAASSLSQLTGGRYCMDWTCRTLSLERLRAHLVHGEMLVHPDGNAGVIALALDDKRDICHVWGQDDALVDMLYAVRALPAADHPDGPEHRVRALLPTAYADTLVRAGFALTDETLDCYELSLGEGLTTEKDYWA